MKVLSKLSLVMTLSLCCACCGNRDAADFISVRDGQFVRGDKPYGYYIGTNMWYGPVLVSDTEAADPDRLAEELRGELTEYRDCQLMAGKLAEQANGFNFFSREPQEIDVDMTYTRLHEPSELYKAYMAAVGKGKRKLPPPVEAFSGIIAKKIVSVSSRFSYILRKLGRNKKQKFISFFERSTSRSEMVATFMAMLALVKSKKVEINGDGGDAEVTLITDRR